MTSRNVVIGPLTFEYQVVRHEIKNHRIRVRYRRPGEAWKWVKLADVYPALRSGLDSVFEAPSLVAAERALEVHIVAQRERDADLDQSTWVPFDSALTPTVN